MFFNDVYYKRYDKGFMKDFTYDLVYEAALSYTIRTR